MTMIFQRLSLRAAVCFVGALFGLLGGAGNAAPAASGAVPGTAETPPAGSRIRFAFSNGSNRFWPDDQVYITITGGTTRKVPGQPDAYVPCHLDRAGHLLPVQLADNTLHCPEDPQNLYADYAIKLSELPFLDIDAALAIDSGRIYVSLGDRLWIRVVNAYDSAGRAVGLGIQQPDIENPTDPNRSLYFDWVEFALDGTGLHLNTTCVDQFGFPLTAQATDTAGTVAGPVGVTRSRADLFAEFKAFMDAHAGSAAADFTALIDPGGRRILAPAHSAAFQPGQGGRHVYFDAYLAAQWKAYQTRDLVLSCAGGPFTGRVDPAGTLSFSNADGGPYTIPGVPTTQEVFRCDGKLTKGAGDSSGSGVVRAQVAALVNRHLLENAADWNVPSAYYAAAPCNYYAAFWHGKDSRNVPYSLNQLAYAFAYDDVGDQSPSLYVRNPRTITIGFSWN